MTSHIWNGKYKSCSKPPIRWIHMGYSWVIKCPHFSHHPTMNGIWYIMATMVGDVQYSQNGTFNDPCLHGCIHLIKYVYPIRLFAAVYVCWYPTCSRLDLQWSCVGRGSHWPIRGLTVLQLHQRRAGDGRMRQKCGFAFWGNRLSVPFPWFVDL